MSCSFCRTHEKTEEWLWALTNWLGYLGTFANLRKRTISFVMSACPSVCMEKHGSHWTDFRDIWYLNIYRNSVAKIQLSLKSDMNDVYFRWRPLYIFVISHPVLLGMRNVSDKHFRENQTTRWFSITLFFYSCLVWDNVENFVESGRPWMKIWRLRIACWKPETANTPSECVILIAFLL
jgi:hypothetical protein